MAAVYLISVSELLRSLVTNRKANKEGDKAQWLKILNLLNEKRKSIVESYKYEHAEAHILRKLELRKLQLHLKLRSKSSDSSLRQGHRITAKRRNIFLFLITPSPSHNNFCKK